MNAQDNLESSWMEIIYQHEFQYRPMTLMMNVNEVFCKYLKDMDG